MKNGIVNYELFLALDQVRQNLHITSEQWAKAAGLSGKARITELRNQYEGRALTYEKVVKLSDALKNLKGEAMVTKELMKLIKKSESGRNKVILMTLAIPEKNIKQCELYLEALLEAAAKKE